MEAAKTIISMLLVATALYRPAHADDIAVVIHVASEHFLTQEQKGAYKKLNEVNPGIGIERNNVIGGIYLNSNSNLSVYAGYNFELARYAGIKAGVVTGYEDVPIAPMVAAYVRVWHMEIVFVPPSPKTAATVGYSLRF